MDSSRDPSPDLPNDTPDDQPRRMKRSTLRTLLTLTVVFDIALLGVLLYDYFQNESDWMLYILIAFAVFVILALILFLMAGRTEPAGERVVVKEIEGPTEFQERIVERPVIVHAGIQPIPPAPIRALRENPPRRIPAPARPVSSGIPFVYNGYTLYHKVVQLKNEGGKRTIYYFAKKKPKSGAMCAKPLGYHVGVNERTGLPFLKKGAGKDGEDLTPTSAASDEYRPQCSAITEDGKQCRNSARGGSKYCGPHFGYQPKTLKGSAKHIEGDDWSEDDDQTDSATVREADTKARVKGAKDTKPAVRKSILGRFRKRPAA
ncbi:MAG TPA: hypothetical protein VM327_00045 [Candidatus Thermoplasmatota archaeon]|nr:hypothetical protein [Candidatus Thermoplasmatota archaeon]